MHAPVAGLLPTRLEQGPSYLHPQKFDSIRVAFGGPDAPGPQEVNKKIADGWRPEIPPALEYHHPKVAKIIVRCLSQDQEERPSALELLQVLQDAEEDESAIAKDDMISMDLAEEDKTSIDEMSQLSQLVDDEMAKVDSSLKAFSETCRQTLNTATEGISGDYGATFGLARTSEGNLVVRSGFHVHCSAEDFAASWTLVHRKFRANFNPIRKRTRH